VPAVRTYCANRQNLLCQLSELTAQLPIHIASCSKKL